MAGRSWPRSWMAPHGACRRQFAISASCNGSEPGTMLALPPEEQYLVSTGRTYFQNLAFDQVHRLQFDLETTGLDARHDRIFMISIRDHTGASEVLEARDDSNAGEAELIETLIARVRDADPDVIENHNLHGFDLPFLARRARILGVPIALGRARRRGAACACRRATVCPSSERPDRSEPGRAATARPVRRARPRVDRHTRCGPPLRLLDPRVARPWSQGRRKAPRHRTNRTCVHPWQRDLHHISRRPGPRSPVRHRRRRGSCGPIPDAGRRGLRPGTHGPEAI